MKSKLISGASEPRIYVVVLEEGEEAFRTLTDFVRSENLTAASLTAIGAFAHAVVGWFDLAGKTYKRIEVREQCEVLSIVGGVAVDDQGRPGLHVHAVLGLEDGSTRGGHLIEGEVRPTLEVILTESPATIRRRKRDDLGIALIDLA
jgi:predicted DNA-binding protein with PD1-like motif